MVNYSRLSALRFSHPTAMNTATSSSLPALAAAAFDADVLAASHARPVVVDFSADWCGPCRALAPVLARIAAEPDLGGSIVTVDADAEPGLAARYDVRALPTLLVFRHGQVVDRIVGLTSARAIRGKIAAAAR